MKTTACGLAATGAPPRPQPAPLPAGPGAAADLQAQLRQELEAQHAALAAQHQELLAAQGRAEQARAAYADLYEHAPVAYLSLTAAGVVERANRRAHELLGTAAGRLVGRRFLVFVAPESRPAALAWLAQLPASAAPQPSTELTLLTDQRTTLRAQLEGEARPGPAADPDPAADPAADPDPDPAGWPCRLALLDVSERHRAALALARSQEQTRLALAAAGAGVVEWDCATDRVFLDERARAFVGLPGPPALLSLRALAARVLPADRPALAGALDRAAAGASLAVEFEVRGAAGEPARWLAASAEVVSPAGRRPHLTGLVRDVTERRRAREQVARQHRRQQRAVFEAVLTTQEQERRRMAETLHNGIGQLLYLMRLQLTEGRARPDGPLLGLLEEAIRDVRALAAELVPPALADLGLRPALEALGRRVGAGRLRVRCNFQGLVPGLPRPLETTIYRLVQELLNNVLKHAQAEEVFVHVVREPDHVAISVDDDGQGFDPLGPAGQGKQPPGIGLSSLRGQVQLLGGQLRIVSQPGRGTSVSVELPTADLAPAAADELRPEPPENSVENLSRNP